VYKRCPRPAAPALVKLAYRGSPSRAEFPLTEEFAAHSNNSSVGLTGHARVIQDVVSYAAAGGQYYTCDPSVMAEVCLPLFCNGHVCGIIDAETAVKDFFTPTALCRVVAFALVAQSIVRGIPSL
jgi:L-methionine (R)-S-oxide reductase